MSFSGWLPQADDSRDEPDVRPSGMKAPDKADLRNDSTHSIQKEPYNQGYFMSCTANAIASALRFGENVKLFNEDFDFYNPSRFCIYWCERAVDATWSKEYPACEQIGPDQFEILIKTLSNSFQTNTPLKDTDVITTVNKNTFKIQSILNGDDSRGVGGLKDNMPVQLRNGIKILKRVGVCTNETWPYMTIDPNWDDDREESETATFVASKDPGKFLLPPVGLDGDHTAVLVEAAAYINQEFQYYRIRDLVETDTKENNPDLVGDMESAIAEGYPIIFGFVFPRSDPLRNKTGEYVFDKLVPDGCTGRDIAGHAVLAVGYDRANGGRFLILNSWGKSFGQDGYFWLPYERFKPGKGTYKTKDGTVRPQADDFWVIKA